jgi:hypothetical protein
LSLTSDLRSGLEQSQVQGDVRFNFLSFHPPAIANWLLYRHTRSRLSSSSTMATTMLTRTALVFFAAEGVAAWAKGPDPDDVKSWFLIKGLLWAWIAMVSSLILYTSSMYAVRYIRTVSCLSNDTQRYFARPTYWYGKTKRHFIDAPLWRLRHHREFQLSSAINIGTLPNRLQTTFLVGYLVGSIVLTTYSITWSGPKATIIDQLLKRTGFMAIMNMLPLFLLAGRNNPLIVLCGITFDTYNLVHRWLGRIVVAEAVVHGSMWLYQKTQKSTLFSTNILRSYID